MSRILLLAAASTGVGLGDLAIYGFAAPLVGFLAWAIAVQRTEMKGKDAVIERLNDRIADQGASALQQAERMLPLLAEANRILGLAVDALNDVDRPPPVRRGPP